MIIILTEKNLGIHGGVLIKPELMYRADLILVQRNENEPDQRFQVVKSRKHKPGTIPENELFDMLADYLA